MALEIRLAGKLSSIDTMQTGQSAAPAPDVAQPAIPETVTDDAEGLSAATKQLQSAQQAMIAAANELHELKQQFVAQAETQLLDLALEIARKVVMQEIKAGRYEIEPIVQEALSRIPDLKGVAVHLHPDDLARCEMANSPDSSAQQGIEFVADPSVGQAECIVKTAEGTVESHIDSHFEEIERTLKHQE